VKPLIPCRPASVDDQKQNQGPPEERRRRGGGEEVEEECNRIEREMRGIKENRRTGKRRER
jgi:hypothetical protein